MKSLQWQRVDGRGAAFVAIWSSGYISGSVAASVIAPLTANLWRFGVGAVVLAVIARRRGEVWPHGVRALARVATVGVLLFTVQFGGLYIGMAEGTPASTTALIACSSSPLLVAAAGASLGWDRLSTRQWAGMALGVIGVAVTLVDRLGRPPTIAALGSFLWIAIVPGIAGPLLFFALIRQRGATRASSLLFVVPAVTALAAWPILGAPIGTTTLCGLAVAGTGLWLAGTRRTSRERASGIGVLPTPALPRRSQARDPIST